MVAIHLEPICLSVHARLKLPEREPGWIQVWSCPGEVTGILPRYRTMNCFRSHGSFSGPWSLWRSNPSHKSWSCCKSSSRTDPLTMYGSVWLTSLVSCDPPKFHAFPSYFLVHVLWRQSRSVHPSGYLAAEILANCHQDWGVLLLFNRSLVHLDSQIPLSTCSDLRPLTFRFTTLHCVAVLLPFENKYVKL